MFNGIIETTCKIKLLKNLDSRNRQITVTFNQQLDEVKLGDSIALNGVCLTVEKIISNQELVFTLGSETLKMTTLADKKENDFLNLECAMRMNDQINGNLLTGHIDAIGKIIEIENQGQSFVFNVEYPQFLAPFIAKKGSIAIDGVSLTVNSLNDNLNQFSITIIPFTHQNTLFSHYTIGTFVNLEIDMLARYLQRQIETRSK